MTDTTPIAIPLRRRYITGAQMKRMKSTSSRSGQSRTKVRDPKTPPPAHRTMVVNGNGRISWEGK